MKTMLGLALSGLLLAPAVQAADIQAGQALHDAHCVSCHASLTKGDPAQIYTRSERRIQSYSALAGQVRRCQTAAGVQWSAAELDDVTAFLNQRYYKF